MICPNCGQETFAGSVFCDNCGIKLNAPADVGQMSNFGSEPIDVSKYTQASEPIIDTDPTQFVSAEPSYDPLEQAAPSYKSEPVDPIFDPIEKAAPSYQAASLFESSAQAVPHYTQHTQPESSNPSFGAAANNFSASIGQNNSSIPPMPHTAAAPAPQPPVSPIAPPQPARPSAPQHAPFFDTEQLYPPVSVGNWIGTFILLCLIPLAVGVIATLLGNYFIMDIIWQSVIVLLPSIAYLVMLFIYAFNGKVNPSKRNLFRAVLILSLILIIIVGILIVVFSTVFSSYLNEISDVNQLVDLVNSIPV